MASLPDAGPAAVDAVADAVAAAAAACFVRLDDWILFRLPSGNHKLVRLTSLDMTVNLGKFGSFRAAELIGQPFDQHYEIYGRDQVRVLRKEDIDYEVDEDANNRDIVDDTASQKLSHSEILKLKKANVDGELDQQGLIKEIVANSATFDKKTGFAKQKYIKRKEK
ncbi:tRNA (adenine(58)-N(1))-methyltransferase non-catalytic subunit trm6, partial [Cladochytrium tenue]